MVLMILLQLLIVGLALFQGYRMGYSTAFIRGATIAKSLETQLIANSIRKLRVQDRYKSLDADLTEQYKTELDIVFQETVGREGR